MPSNTMSNSDTIPLTSVGAAATAETLPTPLLSSTAPFPLRLRIFLRAWLMKLFTTLYFARLVYFPTLPRSHRPAYTKRYLPYIPHAARIFIPSTWQPGDKPLPLLIDVHGGGFMVGHPVMEDRANAQFAQRHGMLVVALGYRKSPRHQFPVPVQDVAAQIRAVLDDVELPVDRTRVAVIGYSAGGNLALGAVQMGGLQREVKAVVGVYPSLDMATASEVKMKARAPDPSGMRDVVFPLSKTFYHSYVRPGTDLKNPLLSPAYAERTKLPGKMFVVGCEYDMLCMEAREFAEKVAGWQEGETRGTAGGNGWVKGGIRWELVKGEPHGFDQIPGTGAITQRRRARVEKLLEDIAEWLYADVWV